MISTVFCNCINKKREKLNLAWCIITFGRRNASMFIWWRRQTWEVIVVQETQEINCGQQSIHQFAMCNSCQKKGQCSFRLHAQRHHMVEEASNSISEASVSFQLDYCMVVGFFCLCIIKKRYHESEKSCKEQHQKCWVGWRNGHLWLEKLI